MTGAEYIINTLKSFGVTDVFGMPGSSILELMYAIDRDSFMQAHLSYHEQGAAFAASGYAQTSGTLGVAYTTKGPGICNAITVIADAYFDSIPILIITAHSGSEVEGMRFYNNQECDVVSICTAITKLVKRIDNAHDLCQVSRACAVALSGRKGPVVLDINSSLFKEEIEDPALCEWKQNNIIEKENYALIDELIRDLFFCKRPVFLIGNGIKQSGQTNAFKEITKRIRIPIISSRNATDVASDTDSYYGYIGSRGIRYCNYIFDKADFVLCLGNRMGFPPDSISFNQSLRNKIIYRIDIDDREFQRKIANTIDVHMGLEEFLTLFLKWEIDDSKYLEWISVCKYLRIQLWDTDITAPVERIEDVLTHIPDESLIFGDVGNNSIWLSRAYVHTRKRNKICYSMSFATLGSSLCKAIGAYYACKKPVFCFIGDQGLQLNIQELQFIASHNLPILICVINNKASGMIKYWENKKYDYLLHTTEESGYSVPSIRKIAYGYGIKYFAVDEMHFTTFDLSGPLIVEIKVDPNDDILPSLPIGNKCTKLFPFLDDKLYQELEHL